MLNYRIVARGKSSAELYLYDDIGDGFFGGITAKQVVDDLAALGKVDTIIVRINSAGGSVFEGLGIYNALTRNPARIEVEIAMAGEEIRIAENAMLMIHDPMGFSVGTAEDMRKAADMLDSVRGTLVQTYAKRTGIDDGRISQMMVDETWMTAAEACDLGFCDSMSQPLQLAAHGDLSRYRRVPNAIAPGVTSQTNRPRRDLRAARVLQLAAQAKVK